MKVIVDVKGQHLSLRSQTSELVQGSQNFIKLCFNFLDHSWNGLSKTLYLKTNNNITHIILENDYCYISTLDSGICEFYLIGTDTNIRATTNILNIEIKPLEEFQQVVNNNE